MKRLTDKMIQMLDYSYTEKSFYMYEAKEELNLTDRGTKTILNRLQNEGLIKYEVIGTDFLKFNVQLTTKGLDVWDVWVNSWRVNTIDELITYMEKWESKYAENLIDTVQPVVDAPQETEVAQFNNKPEYKIYPENVNSLDKVKEVVGIVLNDVLSKKHQQLLLDEIHGGYFKVTFNSRLRTSLGRCCETARYGKRHVRCIEFNPNYIKYEPDNNLKIDTIIHEICHAITDLETEESNMHGPKWQANCIKYGCSPTDRDKIVHYQDVMWEKGLISHRLVCVDCDKVIEYVNNPSKNYIYNVLHHYYYHKQCGGHHLILETNPVNNK